jgi:hypothetical protein
MDSSYPIKHPGHEWAGIFHDNQPLAHWTRELEPTMYHEVISDAMHESLHSSEAAYPRYASRSILSLQFSLPIRQRDVCVFPAAAAFAMVADSARHGARSLGFELTLAENTRGNVRSHSWIRGLIHATKVKRTAARSGVVRHPFCEHKFASTGTPYPTTLCVRFTANQTPTKHPHISFPKNVSAATTYPSIPTLSVGCITGAKYGL